MPKMKTHSGAKKRFKVTAKGHVKHKQAHKSHLLSHESTKRKRTPARHQGRQRGAGEAGQAALALQVLVC